MSKKTDNKEALKEALKIMVIVAAVLFAAVIIALVVWAVTQVNPIAGLAVFMVCIILFAGIYAFFSQR